MYPDAIRPSYFLSDRKDSQAYHLKWRKFRLMHLCRSVNVSTWWVSHLISKQTDFKWRKFNMFTIISSKLLELVYFIRGCLSSKVALHFNVNYWRPFWMVSCLEAALSTASVATVVLTAKTHGGAIVVFHKLCRTARSSRVHKTESSDRPCSVSSSEFHRVRLES